MKNKHLKESRLKNRTDENEKHLRDHQETWNQFHLQRLLFRCRRHRPCDEFSGEAHKNHKGDLSQPGGKVQNKYPEH